MVFALHTEKKAKLWSDYKSTIDTPWLALTGEPWGAFSEFFGEQIPQENASTLHNDSLRELVYNMNKYLTCARRLKFEGCHMQTLAPVAAPEIVVSTTHGAASDDITFNDKRLVMNSCTNNENLTVGNSLQLRIFGTSPVIFVVNYFSW